MDILKMVIGGILVILGGFLATWYQTRKARIIRMEEIVAEKKVQINAEAYAKMKDIASRLIQCSLQDVLNVIMENESWFFSNRLFLPGKFPNKWLTLRNYISKAIRLQGQLPEQASELTALEGKLSKIANEAIGEIYRDMKIERIEVEKL